MPENKQTPLPGRSTPALPPEAGDPVAAGNLLFRQDPLFNELLVAYQKGDWKSCDLIITSLIERYPDEPVLREFKTDIETQLILFRSSQQDARSSLKRRLAGILRVAAIFLLAVALLAFVLFQMQQIYTQRAVEQKAQAAQLEAENLKSLQLALEAKVQGLLQSGRTDDAIKALDELEAIDPANANLPEMRAEAVRLQELDRQYQAALAYIGNDDDQALALLKEIQAVSPNYKDVPRQITRIEANKKVASLVADAEQAYMQGRWMDVLDLYSQAQAIDGTVNTDRVKEQMVNSYLRSIIQTLSKDKPSLQELSTSETFYRKAISLVPQDKKFAQERDELRALSKELLITKHYQTARQILERPFHTETEAREAVRLLGVAYELGPEKVYLNTELNKATLYLTALANFNNRQWLDAITYFSELAKFDSVYPNGMLRHLLFESYSALGKKYFAGGFYQDARKNYESAEMIAWEQPDNRLRLYQVQLDVGYTLGKLDLYQDSVSYFKYALDKIEITTRAADNPELVTALEQVNSLVGKGDFEEAYASYLQLLPQVETLYLIGKLEVDTGANLGFIASASHSTILAIQHLNGLGDAVVMPGSQTLNIPTLP
jgi:tetratricopeptide (TPR) repeat protein